MPDIVTPLPGVFVWQRRGEKQSRAFSLRQYLQRCLHVLRNIRTDQRIAAVRRASAARYKRSLNIQKNSFGTSRNTKQWPWAKQHLINEILPASISKVTGTSFSGAGSVFFLFDDTADTASSQLSIGFCKYPLQAL